MEIKTGKTEEKKRDVAGCNCHMPKHGSIVLSVQWHLLFALHRSAEVRLHFKWDFKRQKKASPPPTCPVHGPAPGTKGWICLIEGLITKSGLPSSAEQGSVSAWAGISLPLRGVGLTLQVRGDNNSNAAPSGTGIYSEAAQGWHPQLKKQFRGRFCPSTMPRPSRAAPRPLPHADAAQGRQSCPSHGSAPHQDGNSLAQRMIFQLWEAAARETQPCTSLSSCNPTWNLEISSQPSAFLPTQTSHW